MSTHTLSRVVVDILLAFCIVNGWWILAVIIGLLAVWYFRAFAEIIVAGFVYDSLFGMSSGMGAWAYAGTIASLALVVVIHWLKRVVRR